MCAASSASTPVIQGPSRRRFLTVREFQQLTKTNQAPSEVGPLLACSGGIPAGDKAFVCSTSGAMVSSSPSKASKSCHDNPELGIESEVETQVSDSSELPSSASAVAAMQLELTGSSNTTNVSILSEVQRLRQENQALRSENAELRRSPPPTPMASTPMAAVPAECGPVTYGMNNLPASQQNLRFGAPLRYVVAASPMGVHPGQFEFAFDSTDTQNLWQCR